MYRLAGSDYQDHAKLQAHDTYITKADVSHGTLATASADKTIKLWHVEDKDSPNTLTPKSTLKGHKSWVWDIAFSADGAYLVSGTLNW